MKANEYHNRMLTGKAGEWRVASELALRGMFCYFPGVDRGADMLVNERVRVQVKCARMSKKSVYPAGAYWFKLWHNIYATSVGRVQGQRPRIFSDECDVVVLWGIDENRFWIIPAAVLDGKQSVVLARHLGPGDITDGTLASAVRQYEGRWEIVKSLAGLDDEANTVAEKATEGPFTKEWMIKNLPLERIEVNE